MRIVGKRVVLGWRHELICRAYDLAVQTKGDLWVEGVSVSHQRLSKAEAMRLWRRDNLERAREGERNRQRVKRARDRARRLQQFHPAPDGVVVAQIYAGVQRDVSEFAPPRDGGQGGMNCQQNENA